MAAAKILIVEDEIIIARELEARLVGLGYEVVGIASSAGEALAFAEQTQPQLVLMDIVLKGEMNGIEAAGVISLRWDMPVIYLTAYSDSATLERAKITEPYGYIVKPFSERELQANIEMALYKAHSENKLRDIEKWFSASMQEIADGVIATSDLDGTIAYINPRAEELTGWTESEAIGKPVGEVFQVLRGKTPPRIFDPVALTLSEGIVIWVTGDLTLVSRTAQQFPIDLTGACLRNGDDSPMGVVLIFRDARDKTQLQKLLRQIQNTQRELGAARVVQEPPLPEQTPHLDGFEIAGSDQPTLRDESKT